MLEPVRRGAVLDREWLLERYEGDQELTRELYLIFMEDAPPKYQGLREALDRGVREEVIHLTHGLKNMAGAAGAWKFMALAAEAERAARLEGPGEWESFYPLLGLGLAETTAAIQAALGETA